jgi:non-ribosomal peptide synthetase component F
MAAHWRHLLAAMVAAPERAVTRLPLMDAAEQQRMLVAWNGPSRPPSRDHHSVHALFRAQARLTPEAVALRFGRQGMRYAQLDTLSDRLAHDLRRRGVVPGCVVGLCSRAASGWRSACLPCSRPAALPPLDRTIRPSGPGLLEDAAPRFVLAHAHNAGSLRQLAAAASFEIIEVPADSVICDRCRARGEACRGEHRYLIFTWFHRHAQRPRS